MDTDIFQLIDNVEGKAKIWEKLGKSNGKIICKDNEQNLFKASIYLFDFDKRTLHCAFDKNEKLKAGEPYFGYFFLDGDKFYFQANATFQENRFIIAVPKELYKLQRRHNYRVTIPRGFDSRLEISAINGSPANMTAQLQNLSSRGSRASCETFETIFKMNDAITGKIFILKHPPMEVTCVVRHMRVTGDRQRNQNFGIEFTPISPALESKLFVLTMELHRLVISKVA